MAGTLDSGTVDARVRRNNPNVRQQRRNNKKPRKQAPQVQPQGSAIPQTLAPRGAPLTPDANLDAQVDRMRQPSAPPKALTPNQPHELAGQGLPHFLDLDQKTRAMMLASFYKAWLLHPEILDGLDR